RTSCWPSRRRPPRELGPAIFLWLQGSASQPPVKASLRRAARGLDGSRLRCAQVPFHQEENGRTQNDRLALLRGSQKLWSRQNIIGVPMATPAPSVPAQPASPAGSILGVFFSPGPAMEDLIRRPRFLPALLAVTVIGAAVMTIGMQRGVIEHFLRRKMENNPRMEQVPAA